MKCFECFREKHNQEIVSLAREEFCPDPLNEYYAVGAIQGRHFTLNEDIVDEKVNTIYIQFLSKIRPRGTLVIDDQHKEDYQRIWKENNVVKCCIKKEDEDLFVNTAAKPYTIQIHSKWLKDGFRNEIVLKTVDKKGQEILGIWINKRNKAELYSEYEFDYHEFFPSKEEIKYLASYSTRDGKFINTLENSS